MPSLANTIDLISSSTGEKKKFRKVIKKNRGQSFQSKLMPS
jgi:hypothetical protein